MSVTEIRSNPPGKTAAKVAPTTAVVRREQTISKIWKAPDLETHVRVHHIDGLDVITVMDWIPSAGKYGRGYYFPARPDFLADLITSLMDVVEGKIKWH